MAKKRKKTRPEEEKYEFVPPEFDEKQFLRDELSATKRIFLVVGYGAIFGILAGLVTVIMSSAYLGLLLLLVGLGTIKHFLIGVRIDVSKLTRRNWFESGGWFFLTFLAIWVMVVNPPFMDIAPPDITHVQIAVCTSTGSWVVYNYTFNVSKAAYEWVGPGGISSLRILLRDAYDNGYNVSVSARVADNGALAKPPTIQFCIYPPGHEKSYDMTPTDRSFYYSYTIDNLKDGFLTDDYFTFRIIAEDTVGNTRTFDLDESAEIRVL
jgi:hypothetical protein